jgi:hypothetical protein
MLEFRDVTARRKGMGEDELKKKEIAMDQSVGV